MITLEMTKTFLFIKLIFNVKLWAGIFAVAAVFTQIVVSSVQRIFMLLKVTSVR